MFSCHFSKQNHQFFSSQYFFVLSLVQFASLLKCGYTILCSTFIQHRKFLKVLFNFSQYILFFFLKIIIFVYPQWSSLHEERTKIIQEGLLNPSVDILEAMTETEAVHTSKTLLLTNFNSVIPQHIFLQHIFISMFPFFL